MKPSTLPATTFKNMKSVLFIFFAAGLTSTILLLYSYQLKGFVPSSNLSREYFICFGQIVFQGALLFIFRAKKELVLHYIEQMMSVSLVGALLLTPALVSTALFFPFSPGAIYFLAYFFCIVLFMFLYHKRKVRQIHAPDWLSYTWVLYRLIVLSLIL